MSSPPTPPAAAPSAARSSDGPGNFVDDLVVADLQAGTRRLMTRFPPEPNGYLHIGHAKAICLNFGLAADHGGVCNLRFDDTNPSTEEAEFVESIKTDVRWLGFDWDGREYYASDYFERLYEWAEKLVSAGKAYVDNQTLEEIRAGRGDFHNPGRPSPSRDRSPEENLDLLRRMRAGEFPDGSRVLRAKIDMQSTDLKLRDPLLYRIKRARHHRTGDTWCIYPMYDWAHGQSDAIEGVTHSICTLEFQNHRPLYEWFLAALELADVPKQIEFARLNLDYTVLSKRRLQELVEGGHVSGWDDPRMPTLAGLRRRGVTPDAIRKFCDRIGVSKRDSVVDVTLLEHAIREDLNDRCLRALAVLRPIKVVLENFPEGQTLLVDAPNHPEKPAEGTRQLPLTRELWIDRDDFMETPPSKFFRLSPGREVRLKYACLVTCREVVKDAAGEIIELRCTWDPASLGGNAPDGRKVKGTIHWISAAHAVPAEVRLYDRLFLKENPMADGDDYLAGLNPRSLEILTTCRVEPAVAEAPPGTRYQFERLGYFCADAGSLAAQTDEALARPAIPLFNRTIGLMDSWAKIAKAVGSRQEAR